MTSGSSLPDPYPIVPFDGAVDCDVTIPGSKSITNRALLCAALANGTTELTGVLVADDTAAMVDCVTSLGAQVHAVDATHTSLTVGGRAGRWADGPIAVNARMSGTTARFIAPSLLLGSGDYTLDGVESMRERPMADLVSSIAALGGRVESRVGGRLPIVVHADAGRGTGTDAWDVSVPGNVSSQFLSGLLLAAPCFGVPVSVRCIGTLVSRPYVDMTCSVMRSFGALVDEPEPGLFVVSPTGYQSPGTYDIEPDASAASYAFAVAAITGGSVRVQGLGSGSMQGDMQFAAILSEMGADVSFDATHTVVTGGTLRGIDVDMADCSDTAQTLAVVAAFAEGPTTVRGIGFIRNKETDRVSAVVTELARCGVDAQHDPDGFTVRPGRVPHGAVVQTYRDHRMAMSFALLGLRVPGIEIADPGCVAKTFPGYFEVLESMRPTLGASDKGEGL